MGHFHLPATDLGWYIVMFSGQGWFILGTGFMKFDADGFLYVLCREF